MTDKQLKPCPFCGCKEINHYITPLIKGKIRASWVSCNNCGANTAEFSYGKENRYPVEDAAIAMWNRRVQDE